MHHAERQVVRAQGSGVFDVICAGEAVWKVVPADARRAEEPTFRVRPAGGAVHASLALVRQGLRVGLVTVLADDSRGRALRDKVAASGVDVGGVELARPSSALVFVRGGALQAVASAEEEPPVSVPDGWTSRVLLLSGVSPVLSHGAAFCKAARAARRTGTLVVVDLNARWGLWQGRDARNIRMVLREADVVSCSAHDLFGLNLDPGALRAVLRPSTVLVVSDGAGTARATGPFGEVTQRWSETGGMDPFGEGDAFTAAICSEIARVGHADERRGELWARALDRALLVAHTPR